MGISPWYKTSVPTAPLWTISLVPDSGALSITGLVLSNFSMLFKNLDTGIETIGVGAFSNLTTSSTTSAGVIIPASIQYQVAASEVVVGRYLPIVLVTLVSGVQPFVLQEDWEVVTL